uniref:Reverse transcriptase Ty1/copia-type domain-containing protein n=1 Tax=Tanacetum cinerariifolium TaxID=118510 RepID=A0A6L2L3R3_TANCI|nr:hypothetical protein [Tanacetum cinerariifolium]
MPITTVEEKAQRRLEVKARSTLMMGNLNEHQLKFNSIKDAKQLLEAVEKRLGGNVASKKTQKNLLKQQYENFTASSSDMLDQTFDRLQKLVSQLELLDEKLSQEDVNQKLLRSLSPEWNTHAVMWRNKAYLDTMSKDDLYNNLKVYEPEVKGIAPRNQDNKHKESSRRSVLVETTNSIALVLCDGLGGYDLSDQTEEVPNYVLTAFTSSSSDSKDLKKSELMVLGYKTVPPPCTGNFMPLTPDLSFSCLDEFVNKPVVENSNAKSSNEETKAVKKNDDATIIKEWVKAFRVFNSRTRIVEENLHIRFSESTPNVVGTKANDNAGQARKETKPVKDYILLQLWTANLPFSQDPKSSHDDGSKPSSDDGKKVDEDTRKENECNDQEKEDNVNSTNNVNTVSLTINVAGTNEDNELLFDPNMPVLEDVSIFNFSSDDEDDGIVADMNNLDTTIKVSPILTTRIQKDHPLDQIIRDLHSTTQTRMMPKNLEEHGFEELLQIKLQEVWTLVDLPNGKRAVGTKWVFRNKKDEREIMIRNKARLVAQWYTQEEGIDYDEVFAPVARIKAISLFLAYASFKDFVVYQMDVKSDFLYVKIEEEAYMSSMEELTFFLGLQVKQKKDGIFISQDKYVTEILKKFGFTKVKNASTPMETQKPLPKDEDGEEVDVHMYRSMIGLLMYLTSSRPNIMFAVCAYARYQVNPKVSHLHVVKRIFRAGKGFSGRITPLFPTMGVQSKLDEGSAMPTDPHHTPTILQSSSSQPRKTHKPRKPTRKATQVPHPSDPIKHVTDEAVHKELGDSLVRATTIASGLKAEQDSGAKKPWGILLLKLGLRVYLNISMIYCSQETKTTQSNEIASLKGRVKKLKKRNKSRTHKLKRLYKVGLTTKEESSYNKESLGEDASKQGRIDAIDADEDITIVNVQDDAEMFDVNDLEITLAQALEALKNLKPKVKGIVIQEQEEPCKSTTTSTIPKHRSPNKGKGITIEEPVKAKKKDQIKLDEEVAKRLQAEFDEEAWLLRERAQKEQEANIALIETWDDTEAKINVDHQLAERLQAQEQEELAFKRVNTFEPIRSELVERKEKRAGEELIQESTKKQKVEDDKETAELQQLMEIIPDTKEVAIDAIHLAVKSLRIVDWKIHKEGRRAIIKL